MYGLGSPDCLWAGLRQAEAAHFSRLHEVAHRTHRVLDGRVRVDPVLVVEVDHLDPEPFETGLAGLAHVVGPAVDAQKRAVRGAHVAELGGEHDLVAAVPNGAPD